MDSRRCPHCAASAVVPGEVRTAEAIAGCFVPIGTRQFRWRMGVGVRERFHACSSCGLVWTSLAPAELRAFIRDYGANVAKDHFESLEAGPCHGLPDSPQTHEAAERVAVIDALVLELKSGPGARQYRQFTGTTRNKAFATVRGWRQLKRAQKLGLLGWRPKEAAKGQKTLNHPMRDPLLDG